MRATGSLALVLVLLTGCAPGAGGGSGGSGSGVRFDRAAYLDISTSAGDRIFLAGPGPHGAFHLRKVVAPGIAIDGRGETLVAMAPGVVGIRDLAGHLTELPPLGSRSATRHLDTSFPGLSAAYVVVGMYQPDQSGWGDCVLEIFDRQAKAWKDTDFPKSSCPMVEYVPPKPGPVVVAAANQALQLVWPGAASAVPIPRLTRFIGTDAKGRTYGSHEGGSVVRFAASAPGAAVTETILDAGPLAATGYSLGFIHLGGDRVFVASFDNVASDPPLRSYHLDGSDGRDEVVLQTGGDGFGAEVTSVSPDGHLVTFTRGLSTTSFDALNYVYDVRTRAIAKLPRGVLDRPIWLDAGVQVP